MYLNIYEIYKNYLQNGGAKGLFKNGRMSARYYYDNYGEDDTIGDVCDYSENRSGQNRCLAYNKFPKWVKITPKNKSECVGECKYNHSGSIHHSDEAAVSEANNIEIALKKIFSGPDPNHFGRVPLKLQNNKEFAIRAMLRAGANIFNGIIKPNNPLLKDIDLYEAAIYGNMLLDSSQSIRELGLVAAEKFEDLHELIDVEDDVDNNDAIIGIDNMIKQLMKNKKYFNKKQIKDFCNNKTINFFFNSSFPVSLGKAAESRFPYIIKDFCNEEDEDNGNKDDVANTVVLEMGTKFWKIENKYPNTIVTYGKIGTKGRTSIKKHSSRKKLLEFMDKMIKSKKEKGYKLSSDVDYNNTNEEENKPVSKVNCKKFKKTVNPKCDNQPGCKWVPGKGKGCLPVENTNKSMDTDKSKNTDKEENKPVSKVNCKKFKKTVNPKCNNQPGCKWVPGKGKGCLPTVEDSSDTDTSDDNEPAHVTVPYTDFDKSDDNDEPSHVTVPDTDFDKMDVMRYKELRPREVLDNPTKLNKYVGWYMSEKIDGWQALWDGKGTLYTKSYKRTFAVPSEWLRLLPSIPLAGEIKIKGKAATEVARLQNTSPLWKDAEFIVFDLPGPNNRKLPFKTRVSNIKKIVDKACRTIPKCPLVSSEQMIIKNTKHLLEHYQKILNKNGEGLVITDPNSVYQVDGKRSSERVKLKGRNDSEGIVIGYKLGGKIGELKSLEIDFGGIIFNLGIGFNKYERENYKKIFPKGTIVKFSYRDLSSSGKPKEARFIEVRKDL